MNRSHRRSAVMSWSLAAGMVCSAAGFLTAAPTAADTDSGGNGVTVTHRHAGGSPGAAAHRAAATDRAGGQRGGRRTASGTQPSHDWPWPCPDWPYWPPLLPPVNTEVDNRNALVIGEDDAATVTPPMAGVTAMTVTSVPGLSDLAAPDAAAGPNAEPADEPAEVANTPAVFLTSPMHPPNGGPMLPSPPPPVPGPPSRPPRPAGLPAAPPAPQPGAPSGSGLAAVAAQALPGLIGLAALTGVGGLLGYRQAKAGFALHAAGTAGYLP